MPDGGKGSCRCRASVRTVATPHGAAARGAGVAVPRPGSVPASRARSPRVGPRVSLQNPEVSGGFCEAAAGLFPLSCMVPVVECGFATAGPV